MRLTKPLLAALAAALMLPACSIFKPPQAVPLQLPPQPVPVAALALCPPPPALLSAEMDALALTLKNTYDAYAECAATHAALVDWLDGQKGRQP